MHLLVGQSSNVACSRTHLEKGPSAILTVVGLLGEEIEYIARCGITSHQLDVFVGDGMIEKNIAYSSETVEKLTVGGTWLLRNSTAWERC